MTAPTYAGLGVAYYPEHWDRSLWDDDLTRMVEHGLDTVRIGDFAWALHEPTEGDFQIDYYDDFLDLCARHGLAVIFCTPTAAPPMWMLTDYPEILNRDRDGNPYYGPRRHYTYNSATYRRFCARIVQRLADHYGQHPTIVGWQIDNELNCDLSEFFAEADHDAFRDHLRRRFGSLDAVNRALGLTFWSRSYSDWAQVRLAGKAVGGAVNPQFALEEARFFSASAVDFLTLQTTILRPRLRPGAFLTTNGLFANLDYNALLAAGLDFITFDSYPNFAFDLDKNPHAPGNLNDRKWSWNLAWTRSVSPTFGIMEQQAGANGWSSRMETPAPKPGQMRLWTMQSIAHGADLVAYFRWRTSPMGCEIYWHGLNDYANIPNRRLAELSQISSDWQRLAPIRGVTYQAEVAILKDYDNTFDAAVDVWHGRVDATSDNAWFIATQTTHTPCDFLYLNAGTTLEQLLAYRLLVYPHAAILSDATSTLLHAYVAAGGTLVLGARTGYKDETGLCPIRPMPGLVSQWCGVTVTDYTLIGPSDGDGALDWEGRTVPAPVFHEVLAPIDDDTEVLARHTGTYYANEPALVRRRVGHGTVYYLGACFSVETATELLSRTGAITPHADVVTLPPELELAVRTDGDRNWYFALNYTDQPREIMLHDRVTDVITGESHFGSHVVEPFGAKVFAR
ncbi:MAG: beta-galactosidase [Propionibacteriaceae bacterium]|nr:beta-galactosidase [Propionibacteriaceae bacterium]